MFPRKLRPFLAMAAPLTLASCGYNLESVCKPSNNACCAIGTTDIGTGNFIDQDYSCQPNQSACVATTTSSYPAHKFNFFPDDEGYRSNGQFNSGCSKTTWVKESFSEALFGRSAAPSITAGLVPKEEALDCRAACTYDFEGIDSTGSVATCPEIALKADVVGSLFKFFSDVNPATYTEDVSVVPIEEISQGFGVPESGLKSCKRSDVFVHKTGLVQNVGESGKTCDSVVSFVSDGATLKAKISISSILSGTVQASSYLGSWMVYDGPDKSFNLAFENPFLAVDYKGHVSKSGMLYDVVVAEISNELGRKGCVRARTPARDLGKQALDSTDERFIAMLKLLVPLGVEKLPLEAESETTTEGLPPSILGVFRLSATALTDDEIDSLPFVGSSTEATSLTEVRQEIESTADWLDAAVCNRVLESVEANNREEFAVALYERLTARTSNDSEGAARFLRCAFYPVLVPESKRSLLQAELFELEE
jgi:hypothetical protein